MSAPPTLDEAERTLASYVRAEKMIGMGDSRVGLAVQVLLGELHRLRSQPDARRPRRLLSDQDKTELLEAAAALRALGGVEPARLGNLRDPVTPASGESPSMTNNDVIEACARAAHEANRAYCIALGDFSQTDWEGSPSWQRDSAIKGVLGVLCSGNGPEQSHESWLDEKRRTGWKYGPVKDPEKKEHPCFLPYAELPPEQRAKDAIFVSTVRTLATALGMALPE